MYKPNPTDLHNIIELTNISQSYDGGKTFIIKDLNLLVEDKPDQGQFIVLLGASGCGKSTLLRYIAGLQKPTSGDVKVNNHKVDDTQRTGMVFQQYSSMPWMTVLENVALGLDIQGVEEKVRKEKALEMIEMVGLAGQEDKYAQYPTLSGGQLQRVAIARSLLANPEIILMDEPFGALDINTRLQMQDLLSKIWNKFHPTIMFVTHDISEAVYLGDDIYFMKSPPSKIVDHLPVPLPFDRHREMKREQKFIDLVREVEDKMVQLNAPQK
jgi:NitT/TauT family transport system ATP-binding protein